LAVDAVNLVPSGREMRRKMNPMLTDFHHEKTPFKVLKKSPLPFESGVFSTILFIRKSRQNAIKSGREL
jgi:hypothetical protein